MSYMDARTICVIAKEEFLSSIDKVVIQSVRFYQKAVHITKHLVYISSTSFLQGSFNGLKF
jgi:hypothetical protein